MTYTQNGISYTIRKHHKARRMTLSIHQDGNVVITIPRYTAKREAHAMVRERQEWLQKQLQTVETQSIERPSFFPEDSPAVRRVARRVITSRLAELNDAHYQLPYQKISIRSMRTRWGSCSAEGNMSFSYKVAYLPDELRDYVLIHELCHLAQMNHSARFWALVEKGDPQYAEHRQRLRQLQ
jgi:predicted metal-dependent hydrolase